MSLRVFFIFVSILLNGKFISQNETSKWYFGASAGLNFNTGSPTFTAGGALTNTVGCSTISDASGNLLFYTDGVTVWNKTHGIMANGTSLLGNNSAQSCVIVKQPNSISLYYIFTVQGGGGSAGLNYSIVDMSLAAPNGSVIVKNTPLFGQACEEKLCATRHCNGTDVWIMAKAMNGTSCFQAFLLTSSGINTIAVTSSYMGSNSPSTIGSMKFSPNGKKLGLTFNSYSSGCFCYVTLINLFDFNNATGLVSNLQSYNSSFSPTAPSHVYGCEFSPDGTKFYATFQGALLQFDLCGSLTTPNNVSLIEGSVNDDTVLKGSLQLGSDGKIYVARVGQSNVGVINNPNNPWNAANYSSIGVSLSSATCGYGLPNFVSSYFEKRNPLVNFNSNSTNGCMFVNFTSPTVCAGSGYTITGTQWNFGDPASGATNTATLSNPSHTFSGPGTYTTQLIVFYDCGKSDTILKIIPVTSPTISVSSPPFNCGLSSATVTSGGGTGSYSYTWSPSSQTTNIASNLNAGTYTVYMKDNGGGCSASNTVSVHATLLNASITSSNALCYGSASGAASINVSGGSGNYNYTWTPGTQSLQSTSSLSAGVYTIVAYDVTNQCTITRTLQITEPPALTANVVALTPTACAGGNIVLYAGNTGGVPGYSYVWGNSHTGPTDTIHEVNSGTYVYTLTVQDANLCLASATTSLSFIANPVLSAPSVSVCAQNTASMSVSGANSYTWLPGAFAGTSFTSIPTSNTIYTITGESLGCTSSLTTSILVYPNPTISLGNNSPVCLGQMLQFNSNTNGVSYNWNGPAAFNSSAQNPVFTSTSLNEAGNYSLTVVAVNSCSAAAHTSVTLFALPSLSVSGNFTICLKDQTTLSASGANSYTWNSAFLNASINVSPPATTIYTLIGASASTGCSATTNVTITVLKCSGIKDALGTESPVKVYPNPSPGVLNIQSDIQLKLQMYSELGVLVYETCIEKGIQRLDLGTFSKGLYFIKTENETFSEVKRIILIE